ncbi:MAG TPA: DUF1127 domain-containing protein [Dongiaceae bacterium]|nr:DUF1127 domain-containing protein [Dongiaceae bacterium]
MSEIVTNLSHRAGVRPQVTRGGRSFLQEGLINLFDLVQNWAERHRTRSRLYQMPDYMLRDIGVSRAEVEQEFDKPFWRA